MEEVYHKKYLSLPNVQTYTIICNLQVLSVKAYWSVKKDIEISPNSDLFVWGGFISCANLNYHRSYVCRKACCHLSFNSHALITNFEKYSLANCALSINGSRRDGVCTSMNFNFRAWYEVEISFSDNTRQKEMIDEIILAQEKKVCNLQIRYHF